MSSSCHLLKIKKEVECSICCEIFTAPKILELCNHVYCKKCLIDLAKSKGGSSFPCPQCRVECKLPDGGVDGLKDDLMTKSFVEILAASDSERPISENAVMCSICHELEVKSVCDLCDCDLCPDCRSSHLDETKQTGDHIIYDFCMKHKRRMKHFCYKCDVLICAKCLRTDHSKEDHGTHMYKTFVTDQVKSLKEQADKLLNTTKSTADRITKVDLYLTGAKRKFESKKKKIMDESNAAINPLARDIYDVKQEIKKLKIRLNQLENEKATHVENMEAKIKEIDKVHFDSFEVEPSRITLSTAVEWLATTKDRLKELKQQNWHGVEHHQQIVACRSGTVAIASILGDLQGSIDKIELVGQFSEGAELNVSPDEQVCHLSGNAEVDVTHNAGSSRAEHDSRSAAMAEVAERITKTNSYAWSFPTGFPRSQSRLIREWNFDTNGPSCIYSVVCLPEGLAILDGTSDISQSKIFYFPSMDVKDFKEVTQGVTLSKDLTANVRGDLVLLRTGKPHLRVYLFARNYQRYENIAYQVAFTRPHALACTGEVIIVLDGFHPDVNIFVLTCEGEVLHSLKESHHGRLAYDSLNQMVYISFPGSEAFKLSGDTLSPTGKIPELPRALLVRDICCGADGIIVAAGMLRHKLSGYSHESRHRLMVILLIDDKISIVNTGEPIFVDENVDRIRIDIKEKVLIIGIGAKLLFYQMI
ncbi:uncharacterized protein LOC135489559 [Lineus longissimus]|uniref:uncharacterized protein LOC135489559 n=1 Tax=Lineus longissimus TaxID=88925 RepID=UPI00315D45E9